MNEFGRYDGTNLGTYAPVPTGSVSALNSAYICRSPSISLAPDDASVVWTRGVELCVSNLAPKVEACTVVVGTAVEENTAATTCTLTAFVAADRRIGGGTGVGVVGGCAVATGSGSCTYVAPVATVMEMEFVHSGGGLPSSSVAVDNIIVTGGVCGNDASATNVHRCVCEAGDDAAAMGRITVATALGHLHVGCESCPPGSIGVAGTCIECDSGSRDDAARGECEYCPPGRAGFEGICDECALGFQASTDRTVCEPCVPGWYRNDTSPICHVCGNGTVPNTALGFTAVAAAKLHHAAMFSQFQNVLSPTHEETVAARSSLYRLIVAEAREPLALADITECIPCAAGFAGAAGICSPCTSGMHPNKAAMIPLETTVDLQSVFDSMWTDACDACWLYRDPAANPATTPVLLTGPAEWDETIASVELLKSSVWQSWCKDSKTPLPVPGWGNINATCTTTVVPECTPVAEACTVVVGTAIEENTASTTCTLTAFVAADPAANPAVVGVVGGCSVATGSGSCPYVAPALTTSSRAACLAAGACLYGSGINGGTPPTCTTKEVPECALVDVNFASESDCTAAGTTMYGPAVCTYDSVPWAAPWMPPWATPYVMPATFLP